MKKILEIINITSWNNAQKERKYESRRDMKWQFLAEVMWFIPIKDFLEVTVIHVSLEVPPRLVILAWSIL